MNEQELTEQFYDIQNLVYQISILEEFVAEIERMSGNKVEDIVTKLL